MRKIVYAGIMSIALAALVGCGARRIDSNKVGRKLNHRLTSDATEMLDNIMYYRDQHGLTRCRDQELAAILNSAAAKDGDPTDTIEAIDLKDYYKQMCQQIEGRYGGMIPGVNGTSKKMDEMD